MRIRRAKTADLEPAAQLWFERAALLRESDARTALMPDAMRLWKQRAEQWIGNDEIAFLVAEADQALAGILVVSIKDNLPWLHPPRLGELLEMAVDLHCPHHGLSGALLQRAGDWLKAQGIVVMEVESPASYPVEEAFWRAKSGKVLSRKFWLSL